MNSTDDNTGVEKCEDQDKKVCMTIPHQECQERKEPKCEKVQQEECKMVPKERCKLVEGEMTPGKCDMKTKLECDDQPQEKCWKTVSTIHNIAPHTYPAMFTDKE